MKYTLALLSLFLGFNSFACGYITCWDYCSNSYVQVIGNSCDTEWDFQRGCYMAKGNCGSGCYGDVSCWDYCQNTYLTFMNADTCATTWDYQNGCYKADGYCAN